MRESLRSTGPLLLTLLTSTSLAKLDLQHSVTIETLLYASAIGNLSMLGNAAIAAKHYTEVALVLAGSDHVALTEAQAFITAAN